MSSKVAVITGANSGVGFALANQLLALFAVDNAKFSLCLACRNLDKAQAALRKLQIAYPDSDVSIVQLDNCNPQSVKNAAVELSLKFQKIDWLFLNAGEMPPCSFNLLGFFPLTIANCQHILASGGNLLRQKDSLLSNGVSRVFSSNAFGHYSLIRELQDFIAKQDTPCQIIWTSSRSAENSPPIDPSNIQLIGGKTPYENSKQVVNIISMELNERGKSANFSSHVGCPGFLMSGLTHAILPWFIWFILAPILYLFRATISKSTVLNPAIAAYSLLWLSRQNPKKLDGNSKYLSCSGPFGTPYLDVGPMQYPVDRERVLDEVEQLYSTHYKT